MDLDLQQYMGAYIDGSRENLDTMDRRLLSLEQNPNNLEAIEEIFRAAHTLKGMSATMGFEKVAHVTHEMESVLDKLRTKQIPVTSQAIDVIFETFDVLRTLVNDSINGSDSNIDLTQVSQKLSAVIQGEGSPIEGNQFEQPAVSSETRENADASQAGRNATGQDLSEFAISEFEASGLMDAQQRGLTPFLVNVQLVTDCLLKGPRIFMVLRTLDSHHCEIIKSIPEIKDLENEKFDRSFKMIITSDHTAKEISDGIESISEIEIVQVIALGPEDIRPGSGVSGAEPSVALPPPPPPPPAQSQHQARSHQESPAAQPQPAVQIKPETKQTSPTPSPKIAKQQDSEPETAYSSPPPPTEKVQEVSEEEDKEIIELVQLLSFSMAEETYALDIKQVEGIINLSPITRVPKAPSQIEGVINLRGEIIPVINLRRRLKLLEREKRPKDQIIILTLEKEKIKVKVGFLVDSVYEVIKLSTSAIEPPSHVSEGVNVEHLNGVGKIVGKDGLTKILILLNAHKIVFG